MERQLGINLLNNDLQGNYREALEEIGYNLKDIEALEVPFNMGSPSLSKQGQISAALAST